MVPDARIDREMAEWARSGRLAADIAKAPDCNQPHAPIQSDGGSTSYYELPPQATELNDLIEHKACRSRSAISSRLAIDSEKKTRPAEYMI